MGAEDGSGQNLWSEDWLELLRWKDSGRCWPAWDVEVFDTAGAGGGERAAEKSRSHVVPRPCLVSTGTSSVALQRCHPTMNCALVRSIVSGSFFGARMKARGFADFRVRRIVTGMEGIDNDCVRRTRAIG